MRMGIHEAEASLKTPAELETVFNRHVVEHGDCLLWVGPSGVYIGQRAYRTWIYLSPKKLAWTVLRKETPPKGHLLVTCDNPTCVRHTAIRKSTSLPVYDSYDCPRCLSDCTYSTGPTWVVEEGVGHPRVCGVCWMCFIVTDPTHDSLNLGWVPSVDWIIETFYWPDPGEWLHTVVNVHDRHCEIPQDFYPEMVEGSWMR